MYSSLIVKTYWITYSFTRWPTIHPTPKIEALEARVFNIIK